MTDEVTTPAGSKVAARWPDALLRVIRQRDRAREAAVALEQENADLTAVMVKAAEDLRGYVGTPEAVAIAADLDSATDRYDEGDAA